MITLKLKPWVSLAGLEHISSSWQVATDIEFTDILDDVQNSTEWVDIYYSKVMIPEGAKYYIRAKRHYNDDSIGDWSTPVAVAAKIDDHNLLITNDVFIDKPRIYVDVDTIKDNSIDSFTIESSEFKSSTEGHYETTWIIKDGSGKILFISLADKDNLLKITIDKDKVDITNISVIKIYVIHSTASGITSEVGVKSVILANSTHNYEIDNNDTQRVLPNTDYIIKLNKVNSILPYGVTSVTVTNSFDNDNILHHENFYTDEGTITIPGNILQPDTMYNIKLVDHNISGPQSNTLFIKTTLNSELTNIDLNYVYKQEMGFLYNTEEQVLAKRFITHEWHNNKIPIPMKGGGIHNFKYDRVTERLVDLGKVDELYISNTGYDDVYIKLLENNKLIVDRMSDGGVPTFDVYTFNPSTEQIIYQHSIHRIYENRTLGRTGAIKHLPNDDAIYLVAGTNELKKVNFDTKQISNLAEVPLTDIGYGTFIDTSDDKLIIMGGSGSKTKLYDITDNSFVDGPRIPEAFRNKSLQAIKLINNDSAIFRTNFIDGDNNDFLMYNIGSDTLDTIDVVSINNESTNTSILLRTGSVLRNLVDPDTNTTYIYELK